MGCSGRQVFLSLHAVDTYQTIRGPALSPECHEADPFTSRLIGEKPSMGEVLLWSGAVYVGYKLLREHIPGRYQNAFDWTLVGFKAYTVARNASIPECN